MIFLPVLVTRPKLAGLVGFAIGAIRCWRLAEAYPDVFRVLYINTNTLWPSHWRADAYTRQFWRSTLFALLLIIIDVYTLVQFIFVLKQAFTARSRLGLPSTWILLCCVGPRLVWSTIWSSLMLVLVYDLILNLLAWIKAQPVLILFRDCKRWIIVIVSYCCHRYPPLIIIIHSIISLPSW